MITIPGSGSIHHSMSIQTILRSPEFPLYVPVLVKLPYQQNFQMGIIYPNGKREYIAFKDELQDFRLENKNMFRFGNHVFSVHTKDLRVKLLNGQDWTCYDRVFVPKKHN